MEGIPRGWLDRFLEMALDEDLGLRGDLTSELVFSAEDTGAVRYEIREDGVLAGAAALGPLAAKVDPAIEVEELHSDGSRLEAGTVFARAHGPMRGLLTMERLGLNIVGRLTGIATHTRAFVDAADGKVRVADTRKTTPLLRPLEKYAVRMGGGVNHRFGLFDAAMIKDNHRAGAGRELVDVVREARARLGHAHRLICEVESLEGAVAAAEGGADVLLLDNRTPDQLREIVAAVGDKVTLEASGGITLDSIADYAATGVDLVSTSAVITRARWLDVGVEYESEGEA
jgi:nicotinate-nucleotide pyrophosphorylase (carboxylating)